MPVLATARLCLDRLTLDDAAFILGLLNQPSFVRYIGDKGVRTMDDARAYLRQGPMQSYARHGFGLYRVDHRASGAPMGICGLLKRDVLEDVDLGFAFLPAFWRQGYATEAAVATIAHARHTLGLTRLVAVTQPENLGSVKTLEKLGFAFEQMVHLHDGEPPLRLYAKDL